MLPQGTAPAPSTVAADAFKRHARHYVSILQRTEELYLKGGDALKEGLELFDLEWANIKNGHSWAANNASSDKDAAELCNNYPLAAPHVLGVRFDPFTTIQWREAALSVAQRIGDRQAEGYHLGHLGLAYKNMGSYRRAIDFYLAALVIDRDEGNKRGELISLGNIGVAHKNLGELDEAASFIQDSLGLARDIGDRRGEADALVNFGVILKERGDLEGAIANYREALSINREIINVRGQLWARGNLAVANRLLGNVVEAAGMFRGLLEEARVLGDRYIEAETWKNLGTLYRDIERYDRALECYNSALAVYRSMNGARGEADTLFDRSQMWAELGRLEEAKEDAVEALGIFTRLRHPREADVRERLEAWQSE